jgi:hypothetical protein
MRDGLGENGARWHITRYLLAVSVSQRVRQGMEKKKEAVEREARTA